MRYLQLIRVCQQSCKPLLVQQCHLLFSRVPWPPRNLVCPLLPWLPPSIACQEEKWQVPRPAAAPVFWQPFCPPPLPNRRAAFKLVICQSHPSKSRQLSCPSQAMAGSVPTRSSSSSASTYPFVAKCLGLYSLIACLKATWTVLHLKMETSI